MGILYNHAPNPKLDADKVYAIKMMHYEMYQQFLKSGAEIFGVGPGAIDDIIKERTWRQVRIHNHKKQVGRPAV